MRFFNTEGPVDPTKHYYVPHRLNEPQIKQLIAEDRYFILHAPRQSGKTTAITLFTKQLNVEGKYKAFYVNVEPAMVARGNVKEGMEAILREFRDQARLFLEPHDPLFNCLKTALKDIAIGSLKSVLQAWSVASNQPIVLFIDEIDMLIGDTLLSVLRQLRAGYTNKPYGFPQTVCLVGLRDVRDYLIWSDEEKGLVLGGSAFNIKAESLTLSNFSLEQVRDLYGQHTQDTGQVFTDEAIKYAYEITNGQPWLVNALAKQACFVDVTDRTQPITQEVIEKAKNTLIARRDTHIDQLVAKLREPRVRVIIDAIISGTGEDADFNDDDLQYVRDLGLVSQDSMEISNPIYQEIIPRALIHTKQQTMKQQLIWYQNQDGSLDMHKILQAFTQFYRENSEIWREKFDYKESGPHLLMMAFLQRIINGGGRIHREYALGSKRVDLFIEWPLVPLGDHTKKSSNPLQTQRIVIELKIKRKSEEKVLEEGLAQTAEYMDKNNATEGHFVIFDDASHKSWDDKIFNKKHTYDKYVITVWGM